MGEKSPKSKIYLSKGKEEGIGDLERSIKTKHIRNDMNEGLRWASKRSSKQG